MNIYLYMKMFFESWCIEIMFIYIYISLKWMKEEKERLWIDNVMRGIESERCFILL